MIYRSGVINKGHLLNVGARCGSRTVRHYIEDMARDYPRDLDCAVSPIGKHKYFKDHTCNSSLRVVLNISPIASDFS